MISTFPNLRAEMFRRGINYMDLARVTRKSDKSMRNKLNGVGDFTLTEVLSIWKELFPDTQLDELFERELKETRK